MNVHSQTSRVLVSIVALGASIAFAHHGWSSFDETKPIFLQGTVKSVKWQNPHAEVTLEADGAAVPAAVRELNVPKQQANVDAAKIFASAQPPNNKKNLWNVELAPITRMDAWSVEPIKVGEKIQFIGYTFKGEVGEPILRVEYFIRDGKVTPLRSAPAK